MKVATKGLFINLEAIVEMAGHPSQDLLSPSSAASLEFDDNLALPPDDTVDIKSLMVQDCKEKEAVVVRLEKQIATYYDDNMKQCTENLQEAKDNLEEAKVKAIKTRPHIFVPLEREAEKKLNEIKRKHNKKMTNELNSHEEKMTKHQADEKELKRLHALALAAVKTAGQEPLQKKQVEELDTPEERIEKQVHNESHASQQEFLCKMATLRLSIAAKEVEKHEEAGTKMEEEHAKVTFTFSIKNIWKQKLCKFASSTKIDDAVKKFVKEELLAVEEFQGVFDQTKATVLSDLRQLKQQLMDAKAALAASQKDLRGFHDDAETTVEEETTEVTLTEETETGSTETSSEEVKEEQSMEEKSPVDADADGNNNENDNDEDGGKNMKKNVKSPDDDDEDKGTAKRKSDHDYDDNDNNNDPKGGGASSASIGGSKDAYHSQSFAGKTKAPKHEPSGSDDSGTPQEYVGDTESTHNTVEKEDHGIISGIQTWFESAAKPLSDSWSTDGCGGLIPAGKKHDLAHGMLPIDSHRDTKGPQEDHRSKKVIEDEAKGTPKIYAKDNDEAPDREISANSAEVIKPSIIAAVRNTPGDGIGVSGDEDASGGKSHETANAEFMKEASGGVADGFVVNNSVVINKEDTPSEEDRELEEDNHSTDSEDSCDSGCGCGGCGCFRRFIS